jgi:hypothetical protein
LEERIMKCGYGQFQNTMAYTTALSSSNTQTRDAIKVEDMRQDKTEDCGESCLVRV